MSILEGRLPTCGFAVVFHNCKFFTGLIRLIPARKTDAIEASCARMHMENMSFEIRSKGHSPVLTTSRALVISVTRSSLDML